MSLAVDVTQRLRAIGDEIKELQTEVAILDEQIAFQSEVAEDLRIRAIVSEIPLADREAREARDDLTRLVRSRDDAVRRIEGLRADQDALLERISDEA